MRFFEKIKEGRKLEEILGELQRGKNLEFFSIFIVEIQGKYSKTLKKNYIKYISFMTSLQEIHSLPTKITDELNSVGNYRRNIDGTRRIIFFHIFATIYRWNTYKKLPTKVFCR